jgi:hypothetical protein
MMSNEFHINTTEKVTSKARGFFSRPIVIGGSFIGILVIASLTYLICGMLFPRSETATDLPLVVTKSIENPAAKTADTAVKELTSTITQETTDIITDDTKEATNASTAATQAGGGLDENNF